MMSEVLPTRSIDDFSREKNRYHGFLHSSDKQVDSKIQGLVLSQIPKSVPSMLLASPISPRVIIDLIPAIGLPQPEPIPRKRPRHSSKRSIHRHHIPIGLGRCELFTPLNAIMQFILFLPTYRDTFTFAPRSYATLSDFIDQYALDQDRNLPVSSADSNQLLRLLIQKMPTYLFQAQNERLDMKGFINVLIKTVLGKSPTTHCDLHWDLSFPFSSSIDLPSRPPELFVTIKEQINPESCHLIQRQFFTKPDSFCYDLDAFIEYRPDGRVADYITYLKAEGTWYQCDDDRIFPMRSNQLNPALYRSVLLHYTRIWPK